MSTFLKSFGLLGIVLIIAALIVFGPLAIIFAINTLIPVAAIPYNFYSWLAVVIINLWFRAKLDIANR